MIADCTDLTALNDVELDRLIIGLIKISPEDRTSGTESFGMSASNEWRRRYPETISPSFYEYAMERGGFPSCYTGPRKTVKLTNSSTRERIEHDQED